MLATDELDGKMLLIDNLHITTVNQRLMLTLDADIEGKIYHVICKNVSSFQINSFSYPMQISGFAVVDNSTKGWQSDVRYEIYDFEDGSIRFFCEEILVHD